MALTVPAGMYDVHELFRLENYFLVHLHIIYHQNRNQNLKVFVVIGQSSKDFKKKRRQADQNQLGYSLTHSSHVEMSLLIL